MQAYARPKNQWLRKTCVGLLALTTWLGAAGLVWAAAYQPFEAHRPSPALASSARILGQLDGLEAELGDGHAELAALTDLADRRTHAEQIACRVSDEHVQEIARLDAAVQKKWVEKKKKHSFARASVRRRAVASR